MSVILHRPAVHDCDQWFVENNFIILLAWPNQGFDVWLYFPQQIILSHLLQKIPYENIIVGKAPRRSPRLGQLNQDLLAAESMQTRPLETNENKFRNHSSYAKGMNHWFTNSVYIPLKTPEWKSLQTASINKFETERKKFWNRFGTVFGRGALVSKYRFSY